jgi:hypothetical protein
VRVLAPNLFSRRISNTTSCTRSRHTQHKTPKIAIWRGVRGISARKAALVLDFADNDGARPYAPNPALVPVTILGRP